MSKIKMNKTQLSEKCFCNIQHLHQSRNSFSIIYIDESIKILKSTVLYMYLLWMEDYYSGILPVVVSIIYGLFTCDIDAEIKFVFKSFN